MSKLYNRKPKYETDYFKSLSRKVFYKQGFILQELKIAPVTGAGHISDLDSYENYADLRDRMDAFLEDSNMRARIYNIVYRLIDNKGLACCLLRKMIMLDPLTVRSVDDSLVALCKRFTDIADVKNTADLIKPIACLKYNERLVNDVEHLLPDTFEPKKILDISPTDDSIKALAARFPDATIYAQDTSETYDLVIMSHWLHHVAGDDRTTVLKKIADKLDTGGYLFIREMDVETTDDSEMSNFIHEVFYKSRITTLSYIAKDALLGLVTGVSNTLEFQSESRHTSDYFANPLKNYFMMFKKVEPRTETTKPLKGGSRPKPAK